MRRVIGRTNASDGSWRHVAAVLPDGEDNAEDIVLYLDGESDAAGSTVSCTIDTDNVNGSDVRLGMTNWSGHESYFDGLIDDVRLYSTDLSAAQIASLAAYHRQGFTYDKLGNRLTLAEPRDDATTTYTYDNVTNELATINSVSVTYDAAGNMTADHRGYTYAYDYENRLVKITEGPATIAEFTYDALGRRIVKVDSIASETTRYYYNADWQVLAETDDQGTLQREYVYGNYIDEVLLMVADPVGSPSEYYLAHDHLYSPAALISDAGTVLERYEYDAYGSRHIYNADFTQTRTSSSYGNVIAFTGCHRDFLDSGDLKLDEHRHRTYDPETGRWLTHDPFGVEPHGYKNRFGVRNQYTDGANLYEYGNSRPTQAVDPLGLMSDWDVFWAIFDHWTTRKGRPFVQHGGKWASYFMDYPGFRLRAKGELMRVAREICKSKKLAGAFRTKDDLFLINRSYPVIMTLNGVHYQIFGKYRAKADFIEFPQSTHQVTDIIDANGWKDAPLWFVMAMWQPVWGPVDNEAPLAPFRFEVDWTFDYRFRIIDCKSCAVKETTGHWPF